MGFILYLLYGVLSGQVVLKGSDSDFFLHVWGLRPGCPTAAAAAGLVTAAAAAASSWRRHTSALLGYLSLRLSICKLAQYNKADNIVKHEKHCKIW